jgi:hemerythrin-like metal-binding protein
MSVSWRGELSVGNDAIDSSHLCLIKLINQAERCLDARDLNELNSALDCLSNYAQEHFVLEEKIAHAVGYTDVNHLNMSHKLLYKQLDQAMGEVREMGQEWSSEIAGRFSNFLRSWLIVHVINEDLLMKPSLQKYPSDFNPLDAPLN